MSAVRLRWLALPLLLGLVAPRPARAADDDEKKEIQQPAQLPVRPASFAWQKDTLTASFGFRDVVDSKIENQLASGLPVTLSLRVYVIEEGETTPVELAVRSCRVVYDLWDEVYRIRVVAPGGERNAAAVSAEGVLRQCAEVRAMPVAARSVLERGRRYFLAVLAEVNPVSQKTLDEMRRWVTRPPGATGIGPGDALFGSFAMLFVRPASDADKTVRFRTKAVVP